ncbi:ubiquinol-cytochrome c reductase iron-sulfur subunit [Massilia sp. CCM 8694]|uniref:Ubiquinol-cytochrome c reductase iron-sulfur subunit n=1 Tax=Massilia genomosp. 1 TaxID=2609280 RepID=A0ABX0MWJ1_9BURK|nr:ubiquinol-cytochrome c reductase iron-sulfur subunit [Massilia genomosp. 1]
MPFHIYAANQAPASQSVQAQVGKRTADAAEQKQRVLVTQARLTQNIAQIVPGALLTSEWPGRPVWILHRTERMIAQLRADDARLADPRSRQDQQPAYARNATRSLRPAFLVATGICTHLGCVPVYRPDVAPADLGGDWNGGFYCPCHGSRFDLAGRVFKNVPAPSNLDIPPHEYLADTRLRIDADRDHPA